MLFSGKGEINSGWLSLPVPSQSVTDPATCFSKLWSLSPVSRDASHFTMASDSQPAHLAIHQPISERACMWQVFSTGCVLGKAWNVGLWPAKHLCLGLNDFSSRRSVSHSTVVSKCLRYFEWRLTNVKECSKLRFNFFKIYRSHLPGRWTWLLFLVVYTGGSKLGFAVA